MARDLIKLGVSLLACLSAGFLGSLFTRPAIPAWYETLQKPVFAPPDYIFAPIWTALYVVMGVAAFLVWRMDLSERRVKIALILFLVQLVLNVLWSAVFFGLRSTQYSIVVILALWVAILFTILSFFKISRLAGALLLPYILWVSFAAVLNVSIRVLQFS